MATGNSNDVPAAARNARGENGSAHSGEHATPVAPNAAALRIDAADVAGVLHAGEVDGDPGGADRGAGHLDHREHPLRAARRREVAHGCGIEQERPATSMTTRRARCERSRSNCSSTVNSSTIGTPRVARSSTSLSPSTTVNSGSSR